MATPEHDRAGAQRAAGGTPATPRRIVAHVPDEVLLRRFGVVRAVGGGAYLVSVLILLAVVGLQAWPLAIGAPVLLVVTTLFFTRSAQYPRTAVAASLVADALVLGGGVAYLGGTGSGLTMLYTIVVVSAGILLGPGSAAAYTGLCVALATLQLALEQLGVEPVLLHRPDLGDRLPVFIVSIAGIASVGYLTSSYAGRLQELIAEAGERAEATARRGRRRRSFVRQSTIDVRASLADVEGVADALDEAWDDLDPDQRRRLAARLRMGVTTLAAGVDQLADVGVMDEASELRPEPVALSRAIDDVVVALGERLHAYPLHLDVPPLKVVGDRRAIRRVAFALLENVVDHTSPGTSVHITAVVAAGGAVLAVTDDGPGIPGNVARRLFDPPDEGGGPRVGLPLVRELCEAMGAEVRYEPAAAGGSRFMVRFRLAPSAAPGPDDEAVAPASPA